MTEQTGITKVYENLHACQNDMQSDFGKACQVRMLLQIGRREFGDGEPSYFWSEAQKKDCTTSNIRILMASSDSPFLSEKRANKRGNQVEQWRADVRRLHEQIRLLTHTYNVNLEHRAHAEPYLWRIFIFDDVAYVSAYLYQRSNDNRAKVYRITKGPSSLYTVFAKYFDYLWLKYDQAASQDEIEKWATWS